MTTTTERKSYEVYVAADYQIGSPSNTKIVIHDEICVCGARIEPLIGKVLNATLSWETWVKGSYEHVEKPEYPHIPTPALTLRVKNPADSRYYLR